jgi:hypothetical protein
MKKLLFVPVALALVAPLSLYTNNLTSRANAQVPATTSSTLSPVAVLTKDWHHYTAKDGSYSALFPGKPEESVESGYEQVGYYDRALQRGYMMQFQKLPTNPNPNEVEKGFDAAAASLSQNGATIIDQKKISFKALPGREITMKSKEGLLMKMRALVDSKVPAMYIAIVAAENGNLDFPEAQAFFDSISVAQK